METNSGLSAGCLSFARRALEDVNGRLGAARAMFACALAVAAEDDGAIVSRAARRHLDTRKVNWAVRRVRSSSLVEFMAGLSLQRSLCCVLLVVVVVVVI